VQDASIRVFGSVEIRSRWIGRIPWPRHHHVVVGLSAEAVIPARGVGPQGRGGSPEQIRARYSLGSSGPTSAKETSDAERVDAVPSEWLPA